MPRPFLETLWGRQTLQGPSQLSLSSTASSFSNTCVSCHHLCRCSHACLPSELLLHLQSPSANESRWHFSWSSRMGRISLCPSRFFLDGLIELNWQKTDQQEKIKFNFIHSGAPNIWSSKKWLKQAAFVSCRQRNNYLWSLDKTKGFLLGVAS